MSGLRLCFRLAWRAARRERLATFLTALLVALPVVGLVAAGTLARSTTISNRLQIERQYGRADLSVQLLKTSTIPSQNVSNGSTITGLGTEQIPVPGTAADSPAALLPTGSRVLSETGRSDSVISTVAGKPGGAVQLHEFDYADPLAHGEVIQQQGRAPTSADEVAVTSYLAQRSGLKVGGTLTLATAGQRKIVGIVVDPEYLKTRGAYGITNAFASDPADSVRYLVSLPSGSSARTVMLPDRYGVTAPYDTVDRTSVDTNTIDSGALVLLLALLEASLTAGTAFAVGARRRRRDLALIAVNGGRPTHTAGVVLANGLVCGSIGVIVGVAAGVGTARLGYPTLQHHSNALLPGLQVDPRILLAAAGFGIISAFLSAGFPALLAARGSLRSALGKTKGSSGTPAWITVTGIGVFALGIAVTSAAVGDASQGNGRQTTTALLGVVFVELGGVALCPALLGLAGGLGARLPALPRLALRDAARQRARSGPAVAAIAAAVSGAMALSVYLASDHLAQVRDYQPFIPRNLVSVSLAPGNSSAPRSTADIASVIGADAVAKSATSYDLADANGQFFLANSGNMAPVGNGFAGTLTGEVTVAGPALLQLLGASPEAERGLANGLAVVDPGLPLPANVRFQSSDGSKNPSVSSPVQTVGAGWQTGQGRPMILISPATASRVLESLSPPLQAAGSDAGPDAERQNTVLWAPLSSGLSDSSRRDLQARAEDVDISLSINPGPGNTNALESLALLGVAALFSLIVTAAATVLAAAESQGDVSILGAVGATGFTRRLLTASQGGITALLGGALGIAIGLVPGIAVVQASTTHLPLTVPWQPFLAFLIGLPLLAAVGGVVFSRSRLPGVTRVV